MKKFILVFEVLILNILISSASNWNTDLTLKFKRKDRVDGNPYANQLSIVLVFDTTVSKTDFDILRDTCFRVLDKLDEGNYIDLIYNYILVPFKDPYDFKRIVTRYKNSIKSEINEIKLNRNNDCPEPVLTSLIYGLEKALPRSMVFVFTDASAKDAHRQDEVLRLINRKNFTVNFFVTSYCNNKLEEYDVYNRIAKKGDGKLYDLNPDQISTVLDFVKTMLDKSSTLLEYFSSAYKGNFSIPLIVDNSINNISISITGKDIAFTVIDPNGNVFEDYLEHLQLSTVKAFILNKPIIGKWLIVYQSSTPNSVKIFSHGSLSFKFGFSQNIINDVGDTKFTPHKGKNILSIFPSNVSLLRSLVDVELVLYNEIFDIEDEVVFFKLPLLQIDTDRIVYRTERFTPPNILFKIYVNGYDNGGNSIRRLLSSQIITEKPINETSLPEISIEMKHNDNLDDLQITCRVISLVPINIQWLKGDVFIKETDSDHSAELNLAVAEISQKDSKPDVLKCFARNMNGETFSTMNTTDITKSIHDRLLNPIQKKLIVKQDSQIDAGHRTNKTIEIIEKHSIEPYREAENKTKNINIQQHLINSSSEMVEVLHGTSLNISCKSSDTPTSITNWLYNDEELDILNKKLFDFNQILHFDSIKIEDKGNYTCIYKDIFGVIQRSFIIDVLYYPRNIDAKNLIEIRTTFGKDVQIKCPITRNPKSVYRWLVEIPEMGADILTNYTDSVVQLYSVQESINYTCLDKNNYETLDVKFNIIVEKPPVLKNSKNETLQAIHGSNVTLECELYPNNIETKIFWLQDKDYIYYNNITEKNNIKIINNGEKLIIQNLTDTDNGEYICYALNAIDNAQKKFQLFVSSPAVWSDWTPWSSCSSTCGPGQITRTRSCFFLNRTVTDNSDCSFGNFLESKNCTNSPCPNEDIWTEWSSWSTCSKSCYDENNKQRSYKQRYRRCNVDDIKLCGYVRIDFITVECNVPLCPIDGGWSRWYISDCSKTCDEGKQTKIRYCNEPSRKNGGRNCIGHSKMFASCNLVPCNKIKQCETGFRYNKIRNICEDIDECKRFPCATNEICTNSYGSYNCTTRKYFYFF